MIILGLGLSLSGIHAGDALDSLAKVRALSDETARKNLPVQITAVVLYADCKTHDLIIHDGTAACYASTDLLTAAPGDCPKPGDQVALEGITTDSGFLPHIGTKSWKILGQAPLPDPYRISADEIYLPRFDAAWVEVPAMVVGVETGGLAYTLTIQVYGQTFKADVPNSDDAAIRASALMQRPVRMRAVLGTVFNNTHQLTGRHFFVPSFDDLIPTAPAANASDAPMLTVVELLKSNSSPADLVRVQGVITQVDAKGFHLRDQKGSAFVQAVMTDHLPPGTVVCVEGYGAIAPFRPILRATKVTQIGSGPPPEPRTMDFHAADLSTFQMELVTVEAHLLGSRTVQDESILQCSSDGTVFDAVLPTSSVSSDLIPGDKLKLTGICELTTTHPIPRPEWVNGFRIRLPGPEQLILLERAPWWTSARLLTALGVMTGLAGLGGFGTLFFRSVVNRQARMIGEKLGNEAVSEERERMARDLHDTLEQQLTGVAMQLESLAKFSESQNPGFSKRIDLARRMIRHSREEARRSVWDLRNQVLETHGLAAALQSLAESTAIDGGPKVEVHISGTAQNLEPATEYQLLRMSQEALANALKHANASRIVIELSAKPERHTLVIQDDGIGFDPHLANPPGPPHFGWIGMRERAAKIGASIEINSRPGSGCTVTIQLPPLES